MYLISPDSIPEDNLKKVIEAAQKRGMPLPFIHEYPVEPADPIEWLASEDVYPRLCWRSRDRSIELAGCGAGFTADSAHRVGETFESSGSVPFFFYYRHFDRKVSESGVWRGIETERAVIPEKYIIRDQAGFRGGVALRIVPDDDMASARAKLAAILTLATSSVRHELSDLPEIGFIAHRPGYDEWTETVRQALREIEDGTLEKVVPARLGHYRITDSLNPLALFSRLKMFHQLSYTILWQPDPRTAFMSVTPERLYRRHDKKIEIDALSSTMPRGLGPEEDMALERQLLGSEKLRREHRHVIEDITDRLKKSAFENVEIAETGIIKLERIQHLRTPVTGAIPDAVDDDGIIDCLHPTPAVGGKPREKALDFICAREPFERGLYAAPIGILSKEFSEIAVGIRSLLMRDRDIYSFTGAGIVSGSEADEEWRELDSKDIMRYLTGEENPG